MRTLDLNACGVCEMNDVELKDVDGGGLFGGILLAIGLTGMLL
jgi:hypothetical protein